MSPSDFHTPHRGWLPHHRGSAPARGRHLRAAVTAIALLAAGYSASAADNQAAGKPVAGGTLTFGLASDTAIIDPSITGSSITALITRNLVDSLVGQAERARPLRLPGLSFSSARPRTTVSRHGSPNAGR